ncbi:vomeronasal type-1 receptor 1-like [Equus quagga]|uniref:vomeronasal type-1 receptor 1-like n=1 Tax=Equus quagga TaxID=89248 RepID=UPI001EE1E897|nr:vomeronasal type-1 receptor 1-like [Equus quagga]
MSFQEDVLRTTGEVAVKTIFLLQVGFGTLANVFLIFHNSSSILLGQRQKPTHTILTHMAVANILTLLSSGVPHTMAVFLFRNPLSSLGCKFAYYLYRVARNTNVCFTCVLSTYQVYTFNPGRVAWMMPRGRALKVISPLCCTCWMFSFLMHIYAPVIVTGPQDTENYTDFQGKWLCPSSSSTARIVILWSISDAMFIGLIIWSSGSMVLLLHRHHKRVSHIHTSNDNYKRPPEIRAARSILMLMVTFIIPYMLNSIFTFYITAFLDTRLWLLLISHILALFFPTFSPLLLILRDPRAPNFCC